ncbi:MAG: LemA family protein [Candidatus Marinimicrobia bacterium]|nr:LemA family protein [Candidatus Neomarinimicrobiota bacterium]
MAKGNGCLAAAMVGGVILVLVLVFGLAFMGVYNRLVGLDESCSRAWADVETVLQRRFDLIPNLVNTVKGYASHERELLEEVTRLRSQWGAAREPAARQQTAGLLEGALGRLMVVVENYPDLKANQNFIALQDELAGTENRISVERRRFNEAVQRYNTAIRRFPASIVAGLRGFDRRTPFEAAPEAQAAPAVSF